MISTQMQESGRALRCIIVDDEPLAREGLELKVQKCGQLELIGQFASGIAANKFLTAHANMVDLVFLDIEMPDLSGIELLQTLTNPPMVIFTTAHEEYAIESYEWSAIDYLLKPIDFSRFAKAVQKAVEVNKLHQTQVVNPVEVCQDFIYIRADRQFVKLYFRDIRYIEGMKNYAMLHSTTKKHMTAISLNLISQQLPASLFARVNRSFIVNVDFVTSVLPNGILLDNQTELPFGSTYQDAFINQFVRTNLLKRT